LEAHDFLRFTSTFQSIISNFIVNLILPFSEHPPELATPGMLDSFSIAFQGNAVNKKIYPNGATNPGGQSWLVHVDESDQTNRKGCFYFFQASP
jgi:hypothetical protein